MTSRHEGNLAVTGRLTPKLLDIPANSLTNAGVSSSAAIDASKLRHQHQPVYGQESATTAAAEDRVLHVVHGAVGSVIAFKAGSVVACLGDSTITIDLLKNGSSILTAAIVLDTGNTERVVEAATITTPGLAAGDVLEVKVTVAAGAGALGKGVFAYAMLEEDAA